MQNKKFYPWLVVGLLWFVALLNYLDRQMFSTMKPSMMVDIAELAKAENFGRLMAIFLWIYAFMSPISGMIADLLNRKWMMLAVYLFGLVLPWPWDMPKLLISCIFSGLSWESAKHSICLRDWH